jgi:ceramide glucosyltransferase
VISASLVGPWLLAVAYFGPSAKAVVGSFRFRAVAGPSASRPPANSLGAAARETAGPEDTLLLRPCAGAEAGLAERLRRTDGATHAWALAAQAEDGARPAIARAGIDEKITHPSRDLANPKVAQLAAVEAHIDASCTFIVVADSDVLLAPGTLAALVAPLRADANTAVVWAPPVEVGTPRTVGDRLSQAVLAGSLHAFPLLGPLDPGGLVGKLFAIRRSDLEALGGFAALGNFLGEDMELARRLRAAGKRVQIAPFIAEAFPEGRSVAAVVARYARWIAVIRLQRPALLASYPLLLAAFPLLAVTLTACGAWGPLAFATATRLAISLAARRHRPPAPFRVFLANAVVDAVLADVVLLVAWGRALTAAQISWRGNTRALVGGQLTEAAKPAP